MMGALLYRDAPLPVAVNEGQASHPACAEPPCRVWQVGGASAHSGCTIHFVGSHAPPSSPLMTLPTSGPPT
jgi:hypothetical protein